MKMKWKKQQTKGNEIGAKDRKWKEKNHQYLKELQRLFDNVNLIKDDDLRRSVVNQMLKCDQVLTEIAEDRFMDFYDEGYKKAKKG